VPSANTKRILQYLDKIDEREGSYAIPTDFLRIAGNTANRDRWVKFLESSGLITEEEVEGRIHYVKTERGKIWHEALKSADYVGPLLDELHRDRLRPSSWYPRG